MTISSTLRKAGPYVGNGVATSFTFSFKVFSASEVVATLALLATGVETVLTLTTDYTVTLNADQNTNPGGTVTYNPSGTPMASTHSLTLTSAVAQTQGTDIPNAGGWYPDVVENALDKAVILVQQLSEILSRTFRIPVSSTADPTLPPPEPGGFGWNATGDKIVTYIFQAGTSLVDLAASTGASLIGFLQAGVGAVKRTIEAKLFDSVSVKDFGAFSALTDGASRSANAAKFQAALDSGATLIRVPKGTYNLTGLIWPNTRIILRGDGRGQTLLTTTDAIGIYAGHYNNTQGSAGSTIEDLQVTTSGAVGIRVNNGGMNMKCVSADGATQYGVEVNSNLVSTWDQVIAAGDIAGVIFKPDHTDATYNPIISTNDAIQQGTYLNCQATGNQLNGIAESAGFRVAETVGYMSFNTFIGCIAQSCPIGWDLVSGINNCTFIGCWAENNLTSNGGTQLGYREANGLSNVWINVNNNNAAAPVFSTSSVQLWGNSWNPFNNNGALFGRLQPSGGAFLPQGFNILAGNSVSCRRAMYPNNLVTLSSDSFVGVEEERVIQGVALSGAGARDLFQVNLQRTDQSGVIKVTVLTSNTAVCIKEVSYYASGGGVTFATIGTKYDPTGVMDITFTGIDDHTIKVAVTGGPANANLTAHIKALCGNGAATSSTGAQTIANL